MSILFITYIRIPVGWKNCWISFEFRFAQCEKYVELGVDIVWLGDDFGMQDRMMINPELWRKFFKPHEVAY